MKITRAIVLVEIDGKGDLHSLILSELGMKYLIEMLDVFQTKEGTLMVSEEKFSSIKFKDTYKQETA